MHTISSGSPAAERDNLVDLSGVDERADGRRLVGREQDLRLPGQLHHAGVDHDAGRGGVEPPEEFLAVDGHVEDAPAEGARRARVLEVERHVVGRRRELRRRPLHGELLAPAGGDPGLERLGRRLVPEVVGRDVGVALHHGVGVRERRPVPVVRVIWIARNANHVTSGFPGRPAAGGLTRTAKGEGAKGAGVPDDVALAAESVARHGAHDEPAKVGGVVHGVGEVDDLERGDEGAGLGVGAARQAHAHGPALPLRHHLEVGGHAVPVVVRGVDGAPQGAVHDLVEHGGFLAAVEAAVEVGGADEVARALDDGELVAVLARGGVREVAQRGEHGEEVGLVDGGGVADGGEALILGPIDAPYLHVLARPAAYVEPLGLWHWHGGRGGRLLGGRGRE